MVVNTSVVNQTIWCNFRVARLYIKQHNNTMRSYTVEDLFYMSNDARTPKELNKGDIISIGEITKVRLDGTGWCHERHCSTPCNNILLSVPAIPDYYSRTRRHIMCRNHIHNYWGALEWWKEENNLERISDLGSRDIKFRVK